MTPCSLVQTFSSETLLTYICEIYNLKLEVESSSEMFVLPTKLHDITSRKTVAFAKTSNSVNIIDWSNRVCTSLYFILVIDTTVQNNDNEISLHFKPMRLIFMNYSV